MPRFYSPEFNEDFDPDALDEDEESDPYLAPPDAFRYLAPPNLGGPNGPVYVQVDPGAAVAPETPKRGLLSRLFGGPPPRVDAPAEKARNGAAQLARQLVKLGAVKAYIRYDGGNDEGFAWFDSCVFADGSVRSADQVARDLVTAGPAAAAIVVALYGRAFDLRETLDDLLASTWAVDLLGRGFGTGEYVMYGGAWIDLKTGLVTDDPNPAPVVQNIRFGTAQ